MSTFGQPNPKIKEIQNRLQLQRHNVQKAERAYVTFVQLEKQLLYHGSLNHTASKESTDYDEDQIIANYKKQILHIIEAAKDPNSIQSTMLVPLRELSTNLVNKLRVSLSEHHTYEKLVLIELTNELKRLQHR